MLLSATDPPYSSGQVGFRMSPLLLLEQVNRIKTLARYINSSHVGMTFIYSPAVAMHHAGGCRGETFAHNVVQDQCGSCF